MPLLCLKFLASKSCSSDFFIGLHYSNTEKISSGSKKVSKFGKTCFFRMNCITLTVLILSWREGFAQKQRGAL
jgi:hypothetical protein